MAVFPPFCYLEQQALLKIAGGLFKAQARLEQSLGWKAFYKASQKEQQDEDTDEQQSLPPLTQGQELQSGQSELVSKQTQPPAYFTDATLLAAMTGISRFVTDPELKRILKETAGLGTEATRAGILELLFKRGYLQRHGKQIRASQLGRVFIQSLPERITTPDLTALWEAQLEQICHQQKIIQSLWRSCSQKLSTWCNRHRCRLKSQKPPLNKSQPIRIKDVFPLLRKAKELIKLASSLPIVMQLD